MKCEGVVKVFGTFGGLKLWVKLGTFINGTLVIFFVEKWGLLIRGFPR